MAKENEKKSNAIPNVPTMDVVAIVASSEQSCHEIAASQGIKNYVAVWDIESYLKCTGHEKLLYAEEEFHKIPIADRLLMFWYARHLCNNGYNGFGWRDMYPERVDAFVAWLVNWIELESYSRSQKNE